MLQNNNNNNNNIHICIAPYGRNFRGAVRASSVFRPCRRYAVHRCSLLLRVSHAVKVKKSDDLYSKLHRLL